MVQTNFRVFFIENECRATTWSREMSDTEGKQKKKIKFRSYLSKSIVAANVVSFLKTHLSVWKNKPVRKKPNNLHRRDN